MPGTPHAAVRIEPYTEAHGYTSPNGGGISPGSNASTDTDSHSVDSNPRNDERTRKTSGSFIPTRAVSLLSGDRKPAYNPMQFVKVGPAKLYQVAQKQIKQAEEVKIARGGIRAWRDDEEDWQSNLTNWKSTRRKKVEHVIERVVEAKKYEEEAFDRDAASRRRKTFSEMMQERSEKGRKARTSFDLSVYTEDDDRRGHDDDDDDGGDETSVHSNDDDGGGGYWRSNDSRSGQSDGSNGHFASKSDFERSGRGPRDADGDSHGNFNGGRDRDVEVLRADDGDDYDDGEDGGRDGGIVGASSAVAQLSKSVNDLSVGGGNGERSRQDEDSGFGSSLYKAPSTPHVWSTPSAKTSSMNYSGLGTDDRQQRNAGRGNDSTDDDDVDDDDNGGNFVLSGDSSLDGKIQRRDGGSQQQLESSPSSSSFNSDANKAEVRRTNSNNNNNNSSNKPLGPTKSFDASPSPSSSSVYRSDDEWRRIQELENNLIKQLEEEESERAKFALGHLPSADLVIETDLGVDDPGSLLLSPSSKEPPKEKPPPPPSSEPPPLVRELDRNKSGAAAEDVVLRDDDGDDDDGGDDNDGYVEDEYGRNRFAAAEQQLRTPPPSRRFDFPAQPPPPPPQPQEAPPTIVSSTAAALMDTFISQKSALRQTLSSSSSATGRSASPPPPPSVTVRPAAATAQHQHHPPAVRSTSVSNRVRMWETGNFPRQTPSNEDVGGEEEEVEGEEEEEDVAADKDGGGDDAMVEARNRRNDYEREREPIYVHQQERHEIRKETASVSSSSASSSLTSTASSSRPEVPIPVPKESVRELYHNPAFAARDSPQPLPPPHQMSSSWNGDDFASASSTSSSNYYQNVAELRAAAAGRPPSQQFFPPTGSNVVGGAKVNGAVPQQPPPTNAVEPVPRSVSATGFGAARHGAMHNSSHSDSSLRPRPDDGMWKAANGSSSWNRYEGNKPEGAIQNGYQPHHQHQQQQPQVQVQVQVQSWDDDVVNRALRSTRSVEDLPQMPHHPHHLNHHAHNPPPAPQPQPQPQPHKTLPPLPHQLQQQQQQQQARQQQPPRVSIGPYAPGTGVQRPSVQPPPPPPGPLSSSSSTSSLTSVPRARAVGPGRSEYAPHGHVVYQSQQLQQQHASQPIYENLPPPVKRAGPAPPQQQAQQMDPVFHNSQVAMPRGSGVGMPWQHVQPPVQQAQQQQPGAPQQQFVPGGGPQLTHGFADPRLGIGVPQPGGAPPMLSVSGKKKCSHCGRELGRGAAMIVESLRLFYHLECFRCCVCEAPLGNGKTGADVRVRNNRLHCHNCYSNEQGVKFSKV